MDELRFRGSLWHVLYADSTYVVAPSISCRSFRRRWWRTPVIKVNGWEWESPVDESRCANLGRFYFIAENERPIRVASRIIAPALISQRHCAITLTWIFTWPRRTTCSYQRRLSIVLRVELALSSRVMYYRILLSKDRARVKSVAIESRQVYHVRGIVSSYHYSTMSLWPWNGRSTHKRAYAWTHVTLRRKYLARGAD